MFSIDLNILPLTMVQLKFNSQFNQSNFVHPCYELCQISESVDILSKFWKFTVVIRGNTFSDDERKAGNDIIAAWYQAAQSAHEEEI